MIREKLQEVFRDVFDDENIEIFDEMTANDIDDWDSLMHMNLIVSIEETFGIKFSTADILNAKNVLSLINAIESKKK